MKMASSGCLKYHRVRRRQPDCPKPVTSLLLSSQANRLLFLTGISFPLPLIFQRVRANINSAFLAPAQSWPSGWDELQQYLQTSLEHLAALLVPLLLPPGALHQLVAPQLVLKAWCREAVSCAISCDVKSNISRREEMIIRKLLCKRWDSL